MAEREIKFRLDFPENQKRKANLPTTNALSYDNLSEFIEERDRLKRDTENRLNASLRVDYSEFGNHVFFDSAEEKLRITQKRILDSYPYNGTKEEKDAFHLTGSDYEKYLFNQWPRYVGYSNFNGTSQYITASDRDNKLMMGSSSFYVSAWIDPYIAPTETRTILSYMSQSGANTWGFALAISDTPPMSLSASVFSGSDSLRLSASIADYTGSFSNIALLYDTNMGSASLYIDGTEVDIAIIAGNIDGPIEFKPSTFNIASGVFEADMYSGSMGEVRFLHTGSAVHHVKNYSRPIDAENYVKLNYTFNEGVVSDNAIDSIVVDYSQNGVHGAYVNYAATARTSGTVMRDDPGNIILYDFHSDLIAFTSSLVLSASTYDNLNGSYIGNFIPETVLSEDENASGLYTSFTLALARYFDSLKLYIDQLDNLKVTNYEESDETPDLFLPTLQKYFGWKVTDHFANVGALPFFYGDEVLVTGSLTTPIHEIRNQFWRRTLNNLPYLLKGKGKRTGIEAFFNVLGVNKDNVRIKEYGGGSRTTIQDLRVHREKPVSMLGIGTGSYTGSFVRSLTARNNQTDFTVETWAQFPYPSASYTNLLLTGSIWQFVDTTQARSLALVWNRDSLTTETGKIILTASDGASLSGASSTLFDGDIVYVAAGLSSSHPFIEVRTIDNDEIDFSASYSGSQVTDVATGSFNAILVGSTSGTLYEVYTQGYYGEYRLWSRALSGSEIDDHALHFGSVGTLDPNEDFLYLHWALSENTSSNSDGEIANICDLSRNGRTGTGYRFEPSANPYEKFLLEYNYLNPSIDLRWFDNKIRTHNKTELTIDDIPDDFNDVSIEFNLIDSLNEDISKIFATLDSFNEYVGQPINKYRDEYADLEALRRTYFERLGDSLNFSAFFDLFRWFDKKIGDSIKQLLPARVRFIGGEQVVESHFLERPKYDYKYPVFRTPKAIPEMQVTGSSGSFDGDLMIQALHGDVHGAVASNRDDKDYVVYPPIGLNRQNSFLSVDGVCYQSPVTTYGDGAERLDRYNASCQSIGGKIVRSVSRITDQTADPKYAVGLEFSGNLYFVTPNETNGTNNDYQFAKSHVTASHQWTISFTASQEDVVTPIALLTDGSNIYYLGQHGLYVSTDSGSAWDVVYTTETTATSSTGLALGPGGEVYISAKTTVAPLMGYIISSSDGTSGSFDSYYTSGSNGFEDVVIDGDFHIYGLLHHHDNTMVIMSSSASTGIWASLHTASQEHTSATGKLFINNGIIYSVAISASGEYIESGSSTSASWGYVSSNSNSYMTQTNTVRHMKLSDDGYFYATTVSGSNNEYLYVFKTRDFVTYKNHHIQRYGTTEGGSSGSIIPVVYGGETIVYATFQYDAGSDGWWDIVEIKERPTPWFNRIKVSGDSQRNIFDPSTGINFKNEFAKKTLANKDRDNEAV